MKKVIALFFLTAYLLSSTEMGQLLKIPAFITHFKEHQQQDRNISLWEFLCIHYAHGNVKDADYEKDMKLPFKTHDYSGLQFNFTTPPKVTAFIAARVVYFSSPKKYYTTDADFTASFHSLIWQPPRSC